MNSGKKYRASPNKKNKYSNSRVVRKKNSERNKKHNPPPPPPPFKLNGRSLLHLTTRRSTNTNTIQCNNSATIIGATSWKQFTDLVYTLIGHIDVGDGRRKYYPLRTAPTG